MIRSGTADLPLHHGKVPVWLSERMARLGLAITEAIITDFGTAGWLSRMGNPFWFQALGCVMGMDWHSSGITTSVMGALRSSINPHASQLGLYVCGGRGRYARRTPDDIRTISERFGTNADQLIRASRLSARIDNSCLQDGFQIYLHSFALDTAGRWTVVQQGMRDATATARRYHWHSELLTSFVDDPQSGIVGEKEELPIVNMSDARAENSRNAVLSFIREPSYIQEKELKALGLTGSSRRTPATRCEPQLELFMPTHHDVRSEDVNTTRLGATLALARASACPDFTEALLIPGVGPRTVQSLALVSEVVYGAPNRFTDPARFSFAHGGKDGHPFPVPLHVYDETIAIMQRAVSKASIDRSERLASLARLHALSRTIESQLSPEADVDAVIRHERTVSHQYGGRTVCGKA